jgi:2-oxoglutarate ferredoxin oxidoreductase subunit beta
MSTTTPPTPPAAPAGKTNRLGLTREAYKGSPSTLCPGCGHDSITHHLQAAAFEYGLPPERVIKLSGIGCSSKTTNYFMNQSHGFNAVHGRMPSIATGAVLANKGLLALGVSGDGDTASIGVGQFVHLLRRNVRMVYVIENNGVYGLTKGQFSATADVGSRSKGGVANDLDPIDCCAMAIELGCGYVARSFSGDAKQLIPLLKGALSHRGTALLDVISPCVTFNNHDSSTKSYPFVKEHDEPIHEVGFVPFYDEIRVEFEPGTTKEVALPDGSRITLKKLEREFDPRDKMEALRLIHESRAKGQLLTGLLYVNPDRPSFVDLLEVDESEPLARMPQEKLRPSREALSEIMRSLM